jgi:tetratricopeptide (TPR) repeat protein
MNNEVTAWEEDVIIPTYGIGEPEKNPIFLEKRVYQGSSGVVYPHPVIEKIYDEKTDKTYRACFLENQYLKIMILPELGGRVQRAYDKVKKRDFVYYNQVIKPALVGLTGPWISGGIEFNWPQHHRPSTFQPVDYSIEENADGSKTVWCNEVERMFRTKGMAGFTLLPDKAYLEIKVKFYNRTNFPQTFLWWANPAVKVNDDYQSVFPPDVNAVFDHGKRDVSRFPIATGTYYKVDYSAGVDISRYKNIPVPTSYMAITSKYDFVGCYEHDTHGGMLHVANHHVSPGKKQWTWGNSDFGQAWDRNLTDTDGPYIELMCGVFTDNQPDFSWLMPFEEREFSQYFMPFHEIGYVKNATKEAMVNLEVNHGKATIKLYTTALYQGAIVSLKQCNPHGGSSVILYEKAIDISPSAPFIVEVVVDAAIKTDDLQISLTANKNVLVAWQPEKTEIKSVPDAANPAKPASEIDSIEQLYLTGLHLEQYRHATFEATDYYMEALRREPGNVSCNNAMGLWLMRRGKFADAEPYFRKAVATITGYNPNPYNGEPLFDLGWCLKIQGKLDEAYEKLYKSVWNVAWQDAGYFSLAQIACLRGNWEDALDLANRSLIRNWHNHKTRHLKVAVLRKLERTAEALQFAKESLIIDQFNVGCWMERELIENPHEAKASLRNLKTNIHTRLEYAIDYADAGLLAEASWLLNESIADESDVYPMVYYFLGYFASRSGNIDEAVRFYQKASAMKPDFCFPNRMEEVLVLQDAMRLNPSDAKAPYYLGNYWYGNRQYDDAIACWERSAQLDDAFPTVLRNLSQAYYNKRHDAALALQMLEKAFALDTTDARILMELDQLYKKLQRPYSERLAFLQQYPALINFRDDLYLEQITLYNQLGQYAKAKELIAGRIFHPWEGGEGKVTGQYILCLMELAKAAIGEKRYSEALDLLQATDAYPHNLGEGKLYGAQENDIHYYKGIASEGLGDQESARHHFEMASQGLDEPSQAFFYNDQQPDKIFYQGLAWQRLGNEGKASSRFNKLIAYGEKHIFDHVAIDYFAVSLPDLLIWDDDLQRRNQIHCNYLMGLGHLGLGNKTHALDYLQKTFGMDINNFGVQVHLAMALKNH